MEVPGNELQTSSLSLSLAVMLCFFTMASCNSKQPAIEASPDDLSKPVEHGGTNDAPGRSSSDVETQTILTGDDARVEAGPVGDPQDEASLIANGILPWGPVQAIHTVTVGQSITVVNQLTSPDPFTASYQLPDGTLVTSNEPLEDIVVFDGDEGPQPDTVVWTSSYGDDWEVVPGRMTVYFNSTATEQEIAALIATENLEVVMSWFEPLDAGGESMRGGGGGSNGPPKQATAVEPGTGDGSDDGSGGIGLEGGSSGGNEIAYFDFEYDQLQHPDVAIAHQYFLNLPKVESALPMVIDYGKSHYPFPLDPYYFFETPPLSKWIDSMDIVDYPGVPILPHPGRPQYVAVIDSGVYRYHEDSYNISFIGVNCYDRRYDTGPFAGSPNYKVDKPRWAPGQPAANPYYHRLLGHGTQVASLINATTNNGIGIPSHAPGTGVLPIRLKFWTKYHQLGFPDEPMISVNSPVKAIRALRFDFKQDAWHFNVRVVNMSIGWPSYARNLPWPPNFPTGGFKRNIKLDLRLNDRLYVASAGNEGKNARVYPAAYSNVLGVSGLDWNSLTDTFSYTHRADDSTNYMIDETYPISGVYRVAGERGYTLVTPTSHPYYYHWQWAFGLDAYRPFSGTSAAAPQVSALAYHLFSKYPEIGQTNYHEVWDQIVQHRGPPHEVEPGIEVKGMVNFQGSIDNW